MSFVAARIDSKHYVYTEQFPWLMAKCVSDIGALDCNMTREE